MSRGVSQNEKSRRADSSPSKCAVASFQQVLRKTVLRSLPVAARKVQRHDGLKAQAVQRAERAWRCLQRIVGADHRQVTGRGGGQLAPQGRGEMRFHVLRTGEAKAPDQRVLAVAWRRSGRCALDPIVGGEGRGAFERPVLHGLAHALEPRLVGQQPAEGRHGIERGHHPRAVSSRPSAMARRNPSSSRVTRCTGELTKPRAPAATATRNRALARLLVPPTTIDGENRRATA